MYLQCIWAPPLTQVQQYIMLSIQRGNETCNNLQFLHGPAAHVSLEQRLTTWPKILLFFRCASVANIWQFIWDFQCLNICWSVGVSWGALTCVGLTCAMHLMSILLLNYYEINMHTMLWKKYGDCIHNIMWSCSYSLTYSFSIAFSCNKITFKNKKQSSKHLPC